MAENLHEGRHGDNYRAILEREEDYKCKETFTRGKRSPGRSRKADSSDQSDSVYKYKLKNELRKRRLPCIVHFCLIYLLNIGGINLSTRLGVDKVKPKGWFKYSLQIDLGLVWDCSTMSLSTWETYRWSILQ